VWSVLRLSQKHRALFGLPPPPRQLALGYVFFVTVAVAEPLAASRVASATAAESHRVQVSGAATVAGALVGVA